MKMVTSKKIVIYTVTVISIVLLILSGTIMSQVKEPPYKTILSEDNIEIRDYSPILVAQVEMVGDRKTAISAGFKILADYIFGNNQGGEKVKVTDRSEQQEGSKISMTAPVIQQESQEGQHWMVRFVMPADYTEQSLPKPNNPEVKIIALPLKRYVLIRFSGGSGHDNLSEHLAVLQNYVVSKNLRTLGNPIYAFYNPPWTLPFLRRNEIMLEIGHD